MIPKREAAEAKYLGRALVPPVTKICAAMQSLRLGETIPRSDIANVARALVAEKCDTARPAGGWDVPAQAPASPEHPVPTGSVAIPLIALR